MTEPTAPPPPPSDPPQEPPQEAAPEPPPPPVPASSDSNGLMIVLSYLWILALVPFLTEKDDQEVQWHAKHGLVLLAAEILFWVALGIVSSMLGGLGCLVAMLTPLVGLLILVLHIVCIVKGVKGERFIIPGISQYADRF